MTVPHNALVGTRQYQEMVEEKNTKMLFAFNNDTDVRIGDKVLLEEIEDFPSSSLFELKDDLRTGNSSLFEITEIGSAPTPIMNNDGGMLYFIRMKLI